MSRSTPTMDVQVNAMIPVALTAEAVRAAMLTGARMTIAGVPGQWSATGDRWTADDITGTDTLILVRISDAEDEEVGGVARQVVNTADRAVQTGARPRMVLVENATSAFKRRRVKLPNGTVQLRTVRPMFREALGKLGTLGLSRFIAADLDRTARDPRDLEDLIDVVEGSHPRIMCDSVTGSLRLATDADVTMARVMVAIANKSSRDTSRRVSDSRREQAQEGRNGGGRRNFGWEIDNITPRPKEYQAIKAAAQGAEVGVSGREIARDLNKQGSRTADGNLWTAVGVRDMLLRPRNAGLAVHRKGHRGRRPYTREDVVGTFPGKAPLGVEQYWGIVARLTDPDRRTNPGTASKWFGSGIYRCPCSQGLRVQNKKYTPTVERLVYRCQETGPGHVLAPMDDLDKLVVHTLLTMIAKSEPEEIIGTSAGQVDPARLHAELAKHQARLEEIADDYEEDRITKSQRDRMTAKRRAKIETAKAKLETYRAEAHPAAKLIGVPDIRAAWKELTLGEQREILRRLLDVQVNPVGRGKRPPIHERVTLTPIKPGTQPGKPQPEPATVTPIKKAKRKNKPRTAAA